MTDHELRTALMTQLQIADSYLLAGNHAYGGKLRAETLKILNGMKDGAGPGGLTGANSDAGPSRRPPNDGQS